jgi:hypothetical protein
MHLLQRAVPERISLLCDHVRRSRNLRHHMHDSAAPQRIVWPSSSAHQCTPFCPPLQDLSGMASSLSSEPTISHHCRLDPSLHAVFHHDALTLLLALRLPSHAARAATSLTFRRSLFFGALQALFWPLEAGRFFLVSGLSSLPATPGSYPDSAMSVQTPPLSRIMPNILRD